MSKYMMAYYNSPAEECNAHVLDMCECDEGYAMHVRAEVQAKVRTNALSVCITIGTYCFFGCLVQ